MVDLPRLTAGTAHTLNIDLGDWDTFAGNNLPADHTDFKGTHMLNYDISDIGGTSISLIIGNNDPETLASDSSGTTVLTGPDFIPGDEDVTGGEAFANLYNVTGPLLSLDVDASLEIGFTVGDDNLEAGEYSIIIDLFAFGLADIDDPTSNVNNAIYRLELEEDGDNSSDFIGTLEYIGLNQINIVEQSTYEGIARFRRLHNTDIRRRLHFRRIPRLGLQWRIPKTFTAGADTPTHSGSVVTRL